MLIDVGDTRLHVTERGAGELALFVLHGGPGLDHTMFGSYLDALGDRCRLLLVDERGTGRSEPARARRPGRSTHHAADVEAMAGALGLERYAVLGHSYGAFIALQHAVDFPGQPGRHDRLERHPRRALPRARRGSSSPPSSPSSCASRCSGRGRARPHARTQEDVAALLSDQLPFHFADPRDPRIDDMRAAMGDAVYGPDVLRAAATEDYGAIAVEDRLADVAHPVLVLAGRHDRTCPVPAAEAMAAGLPDAELVVFEHSGHMTFVEENDAYVAAVRDFLERRALG